MFKKNIKNSIIISFLILILIIMVAVIYCYLPLKSLLIYNESFEYNTNIQLTNETLINIDDMWYNIGDGLSDECRIGNYPVYGSQVKYPLGYLMALRTNLMSLQINGSNKIYNDEINEDKNIKKECMDGNNSYLSEITNVLLFKYFSELTENTNYMVNNSDKFKKSSCQILTPDTFNKAYHFLNQIIAILLNHMYLYGPFRIDNYLNNIYDNYALLYRYINKNNIVKISNIDTILVSNHNHAVEWIYRKYPGETIPTIFHVDTHDDVNPFYIKSNDDLYKYKKGIINDNNKILIDFYNDVLNNDVGAVTGPAIYPYENNGGIIWLRAEWSNNMIADDRQTFYIKKIIDNDGNTALAYNYYAKNTDNNDIIDFDKSVDMYRFYLNQINNDFFNLFPNDYILNIDLDYFVTYGGTDYYSFQEDPISHYRTEIDFKRTEKDPAYEASIAKKFSYEMDIIRKRIDDFLLIIKRLKEDGKIPSLIIICNSTSIDKTKTHFLEPWENQFKFIAKKGIIESDNDFTPKYLTLWLQNTLINHLNNVL